MDEFYRAVPHEHVENGWGIKGGGHTVFPWDKCTFEQVHMIAGLMNVARACRASEIKGEFIESS